jgi:hypothetical protein
LTDCQLKKKEKELGGRWQLDSFAEDRDQWHTLQPW